MLLFSWVLRLRNILLYMTLIKKNDHLMRMQTVGYVLISDTKP